MTILRFQTDDPELLAFIRSLGRKRSDVICELLKECMNEGGGYVPPRIMAATGFHYRKGAYVYEDMEERPRVRVVPVVKKTHRPAKTAVEVKEVKTEAPEAETTETPEAEAPETPEAPETSETSEEPEADYASSGPEIKNKELVMNGLAAFGGF